MAKDAKRSSILERLKLQPRGSIDGSIESNASTTGAREDSPPPPYEPSPGQGHDTQAVQHAGSDADGTVNPNAAFENLTLSNLPVDPTIETCLAHLKLMSAFQWMKEDVGFTDGLWGLWDSRAGPIEAALKCRPGKENRGDAQNGPGAASVEERLQNKNLETLSRIREKRWALFVARAVDRYETWWKSLRKRFPPAAGPLQESDMNIYPADVVGRYAEFPMDLESVFPWTEDMLPPLDVLMVWHTHMLNPRAFLEDAMLAGLRQFWTTGLPWHLVNQAIDSDFNYTVSAECKARWTEDTGLPWDSADGELTKTIKCPECRSLLHIPWTTCQRPEDCDEQGPPDLAGNGYGDSKLLYTCGSCRLEVNKDLLCVAKFVGDFRALIGTPNRPMPGTVLDPVTGIPFPLTPRESARGTKIVPHTFPNRLLKSGCNAIRSTIAGLLRASAYRQSPTMNMIRSEIEQVLSNKAYVKEIAQIDRTVRYQLPRESAIAIRKMMSCYWENFSLFALDLSGAVMRQGLFVEKMCRIDWLHSPSARETMARLLIKYGRFVDIMTSSRWQMAVPTLDVDLAWHTHQLSPGRYYRYTVSRTGRFVNHDDKVDEGILSRQFEWTSKVYQERYGEVYSACTCWYCEAIRASHISAIGSALKLSAQEKVAESFHASGAANLHPPSNSAHISSHPSVLHAKQDGTLPGAHKLRQATHLGLAASHKKRLEKAYAKAVARALRRGRTPPHRPGETIGMSNGDGAAKDADTDKDGDRDTADQGSGTGKKKNRDADSYYYYDHWGYPYLYVAPYAYALWWTPGLYYGWCPGFVACGTGTAGGCVAGTCAGAVAAGGCGGPGGCGDSGAGGDGIAGCGGSGGNGGSCGDGGGCGGGCGGCGG